VFNLNSTKMKTIIHIILLGAFIMPGLSHAQTDTSENESSGTSAKDEASIEAKSGKKLKETKTIEFQVSGVCGMCETRIENGATIKGVKQVDYDRETGKLKVIYRVDKITEEEIHAAVAEVGHDTEKVKATDEAYAKLPGCCAYRDGIEKH